MISPLEGFDRQWLHCPKCDSKNIEAAESEIWDGGVYQCVSCNDCDASWTEHYLPSHREMDEEL